MPNSKNSNHHHLLCCFILFLLLCSTVNGRFISTHPLSDGHGDGGSVSPPLLLSLLPEEESSCEETYAFLPCTTTWIGNLFLILVYGYLIYLAATLLSSGSELLLQIVGPGIIGGLFLPILGALPDAMLILVSGLSGTTATAQDQVSVGMGLLAGSTVMLITVIWGSCVVVGRCDIRDSIAVDGTNTKCFSFTGAGVSTDIWTAYAARIMAISVVPLLVVQLPQLLIKSTSGRHLAVLIALILSLVMLLSYCLYQVFQPWIQQRHVAYLKHKLAILKCLENRSMGRLVTDDGEPNIQVITRLFDTVDENHDRRLSAAELKALMIGVQFDAIDLNDDDAVSELLKDFDTSKDNHIDIDEFVNGIRKWAHEKGAGDREQKIMSDDESVLDADEKNTTRSSIKAVLLLLVGTIIAAAFADPLVDAVDNFSDATSIPSFFVSFIVLPLATNATESVSAIIFAGRKKQSTASLTFSELYGSVTMNNLLCLSVFLALVYIRGLTWDFSSEVLVILMVCLLVGGFASFRTTFPLWTCTLAYLLYPFSLLLVYVLDYCFDWS